MAIMLRQYLSHDGSERKHPSRIDKQLGSENSTHVHVHNVMCKALMKISKKKKYNSAYEKK